MFFVYSDFVESIQLAPDLWSKAVSNIDLNLSIYLFFKVLLCYRQLQQIWSCAMGHCSKWLFSIGHCSEFGYMLWATAAHLVMRYGPLRKRKPYSTNLWHCHTVGHSAGFGYVLWAIAQDLVIRYRLQCRIFCLSVMGHGVGFCLRYRLKCKANIIVKNHTTVL
jgi:hypothetical protein